MAIVDKRLAFASATAASLLTACAGYAPPASLQPGQSIDEVTRSYGQPTGRYALPQGGTRLEYARGPYGKHTWMIDADASGRVHSIQQVLTEANFATVKPGETAQDVLLKLGRPSERRGAFRNTELWAYRYDATFCQWFVVTMTPDRQVRDAGYVPDPMCDPDDDGARGSISAR
jgi:hypothetical protein